MDALRESPGLSHDPFGVGGIWWYASTDCARRVSYISAVAATAPRGEGGGGRRKLAVFLGDATTTAVAPELLEFKRTDCIRKFSGRAFGLAPPDS
jgi:hypothetical protein